MNRAKIQDYIDQRADLYHYEATGQNQFTLNGHHYQLLVSYRDGFNGDEFAKRFSNILSKYDYIVGDWGYGQLRLRGFYDDQSPLFRPERGQERIEDYLFEDCNFGCPYFVVQNDDVQLPKRRSHRRRTSFRERRKPSGKKVSSIGITKLLPVSAKARSINLLFINVTQARGDQTMVKNNYVGYFIDLDGTMYRGTDRIPAAARFIKRLQSAGKQVLFVTNNSTRSPQDVADNLCNNHDINVTADNVYTSALATADYLDQLAAANQRTVYVVGERGLKSALAQRGFTESNDHPAFVVVGLDSHVTYDQLASAVLLIRAGAKFVGTNPDSNLPNERGMVPGAGSFVKLVEYATQTKPIMIGKPSPIIMQMALKKSGLSKSEVVMVGDNYHTDIQAAINFGVDSLLTYTGLSTKADVQAQTVKPTHEVDSLDEWEVK